MKPLIQELDRAIERGWANGGHLAAIRELALEAANEPEGHAPQAPPAAVPAGWGLFVDGRLSGHYESEYEARRAANEVGCEVRQLLAANKENNNG
jgi:hypothetical protein